MQGKMKKIMTLLAVAALVAALVVGGMWFFRENYVTENGRIRWIHSRTVVLDGNELEQRDFLHAFTHLKTIDAQTCELTVAQYEQRIDSNGLSQNHEDIQLLTGRGIDVESGQVGG